MTVTEWMVRAAPLFEALGALVLFVGLIVSVVLAARSLRQSANRATAYQALL